MNKDLLYKISEFTFGTKVGETIFRVVFLVVWFLISMVIINLVT